MTGRLWPAGAAGWVLAGVCLLASATRAQKREAAEGIEQRFQQAMAAEDKGDLETAERLLEELHRQRPGVFEIDESLGLIYAGRERYAEALPLLRAAARERPGSDVAYVNLGAALAKLGRNREAAEELDHAVRLNAANLAALVSLGQVRMSLGEPAKAAEALAQARALRPADADLDLSYATAAFDAGQAAEAEKVLTAMAGVERNAAAQSLLGEIAESRGDYIAAGNSFTRAQTLEPSEQNAWMLGVEFLRHWTFEAAVPEFEEAARRFPESRRLRLGLATAYFGDAKYDQAVPVYAQLLAAEPGNANFAEYLGMACTAAMQKQTRSDCQALVGYAEAHPGEARIGFYAASSLLSDDATEEQLSKAAELLSAALHANPELPEAHFELGLLHQTRGQWAQSIAPLEQAIRLKPDYAQAHYRLALAYWRAGRKQEGQAEMDLQKKYSRQQAEDLDHRLRQITTFLVNVRK